MHYGKIFLSDIHLGTRACQAKKLKQFLKDNTADEYYFVGDIIDGWSLQNSWYWHADHNEIIRIVFKLSKEAQVFYLPGNHDDFVRSALPINLGNIQIRDNVICEMGGVQYLVFHGDSLDGWMRFRHYPFIGSLGYKIVTIINDLFHGISGAFGFPHWSIAEYLESHARARFDLIGSYETAAAKIAVENNCNGVIVGHLHVPSDKMVSGTRYLNCGDWIKNCSAIVEQDGHPRLIRL